MHSSFRFEPKNLSYYFTLNYDKNIPLLFCTCCSKKMDVKLFALLFCCYFSTLVHGLPAATVNNNQLTNELPCDDVVCPHFLDPVCGIFETKLVSFPNRCEFEAHSCRLKNQGRTLRLGDCPDWHVFA